MYLRVSFQLEITSLLITEILDVLCYALFIETNLWVLQTGAISAENSFSFAFICGELNLGNSGPHFSVAKTLTPFCKTFLDQ